MSNLKIVFLQLKDPSGDTRGRFLEGAQPGQCLVIRPNQKLRSVQIAMKLFCDGPDDCEAFLFQDRPFLFVNS